MASNKKKRPEADVSYMEYLDPAGRVARVDRLDMSDADWAKTKQTAIDKGVFKFAHDREKDYEERKAAAQLSPEEVAKTEEIRSRKVEPSSSFTPEKPAQPLEQKVKEPIQIKDGDTVYTVPADQASKVDVEQLRKAAKNPTQDGRTGTGTLGGKLKSVAASLFGGAVPEDQGEALAASVQLPKTPAAAPSPTAKMRAGLSQEMAAEAAAAPPEVSQQVVNGPQVTPRPESMAGAVVPPPEPGLLQKMNIFDPSSQINQSIGKTIGTREPLVKPVPQGSMLVDPPPAQPPLPGGASDPRSGTSNFGKDAAAGSGSVKMSASSKGIPDPTMPPLVDRRAQLEADTAAVNAARMKKADAEVASLKAEADVAREGLRAMTDLELERRGAEKASQDFVRSAQAAYTKTVEEMAAPEKIDPDRWWKSRNTAQKIFAVVSAGLTRGATLGMFQDAISRDIQVQQHDISNARIARGQKADAQHNVYQMARNNGLDERAAYITAEANAWANIERASKLAGMTAKAPSVIAAAQEQAALANQQKIEKLAALDAHLETQGLERKKLFLEEKKVESIISMNNRKGGSGAPKPGKALEPAMKSALINAKTGFNMVKQMKKILDANPDKEGSQESTVVGAAMDEASKAVPVFKTGAKDRQKALEPLRRKMLRAIDDSAVMASDAEFWKGKLPDVGFGNISHAALDELAIQFQQEYDNIVEENRKAGSNVAGFTPGAAPVPSDESAVDQLLAQE